MAGAWYVGRASWRQRLRQLLFLVLIAGFVGGAVLAAGAGARRTSSAYDRLLRTSRSPHEVLFVTGHVPEIESWLRETHRRWTLLRASRRDDRPAPAATRLVLALRADRPRAHLIQQVRARAQTPARPRRRGAHHAANGAEHGPRRRGSRRVPRLRPQPSRRADRESVDEADRCADLRARRRHRARPDRRATLPDDQVVLRDPGLRARTSQRSRVDGDRGLAEGRTAENAPAYQRELAQFSRRFGSNVPFSTVSSRADAESADHAARAVVVGLAIVALVAGLAGIVTIAQAVRRYLARAADEGRVLAALGARQIDRAAAQLVAAVPLPPGDALRRRCPPYALSPVFPVGNGTLEPYPGLRADWFVFVVGGLAWLLVVTAVTTVVAWFGSVLRTRRARIRIPGFGAAAGPGFLPAAIGARFALWPGRRRASQGGVRRRGDRRRRRGRERDLRRVVGRFPRAPALASA